MFDKNEWEIRENRFINAMNKTFSNMFADAFYRLKFHEWELKGSQLTINLTDEKVKIASCTFNTASEVANLGGPKALPLASFFEAVAMLTESIGKYKNAQAQLEFFKKTHFAMVFFDLLQSLKFCYEGVSLEMGSGSAKAACMALWGHFEPFFKVLTQHLYLRHIFLIQTTQTDDIKLWVDFFEHSINYNLTLEKSSQLPICDFLNAACPPKGNKMYLKHEEQGSVTDKRINNDKGILSRGKDGYRIRLALDGRYCIQAAGDNKWNILSKEELGVFRGIFSRHSWQKYPPIFCGFDENWGQSVLPIQPLSGGSLADAFSKIFEISIPSDVERRITTNLEKYKTLCNEMKQLEVHKASTASLVNSSASSVAESKNVAQQKSPPAPLAPAPAPLASKSSESKNPVTQKASLFSFFNSVFEDELPVLSDSDDDAEQSVDDLNRRLSIANDLATKSRAELARYEQRIQSLLFIKTNKRLQAAAEEKKSLGLATTPASGATA